MPIRALSMDAVAESQTAAIPARPLGSRYRRGALGVTT